MNSLGYVLLAALAAAFVFVPRLGAFGVRRQDPHELQKALLNEFYGGIHSYKQVVNGRMFKDTFKVRQAEVR